jgi:ankyrin repeat protein
MSAEKLQQLQQAVRNFDTPLARRILEAHPTLLFPREEEETGLSPRNADGDTLLTALLTETFNQDNPAHLGMLKELLSRYIKRKEERQLLLRSPNQGAYDSPRLAMNPFHLAAHHGQDKVLELLINSLGKAEKKATGITPPESHPLVMKDAHGRTPLHCAIQANSQRCTDLLIGCMQENGDLLSYTADDAVSHPLLCQDAAGMTPLHYAASSQDPGLLASLIYYLDGAAHRRAISPQSILGILMQQDASGKTPFHHAASNPSEEILPLLIPYLTRIQDTDGVAEDHSVAINPLELQDGDGFNPFHIAATRSLTNTRLLMDAFTSTSFCEDMDVAMHPLQQEDLEQNPPIGLIIRDLDLMFTSRDWNAYTQRASQLADTLVIMLQHEGHLALEMADNQGTTFFDFLTDHIQELQDMLQAVATYTPTTPGMQIEITWNVEDLDGTGLNPGDDPLEEIDQIESAPISQIAAILTCFTRTLSRHVPHLPAPEALEELLQHHVAASAELSDHSSSMGDSDMEDEESPPSTLHNPRSSSIGIEELEAQAHL